jgi:hypothetical protein
MCLIMIDLATSWFKLVELSVVTKPMVLTKSKGKKITCANYTKVAEMTISNLVYKTWFSR